MHAGLDDSRRPGSHVISYACPSQEPRPLSSGRAYCEGVCVLNAMTSIMETKVHYSSLYAQGADLA